MQESVREGFVLLGRNIAKYRKLMGMSQEAFAEKAGLSRGYLSQIEAATPRANLSVNMLLVIASALDVPAYRLLEPESGFTKE